MRSPFEILKDLIKEAPSWLKAAWLIGALGGFTVALLLAAALIKYVIG